MRLLSLSLALVAVLLIACNGGNGLDATGACTICPDSQSVNTDACATEGADAGCESAEIQEVTDDACSVGQPATLHQSCVYKHCTRNFDCEQVATF